MTQDPDTQLTETRRDIWNWGLRYSWWFLKPIWDIQGIKTSFFLLRYLRRMEHAKDQQGSFLKRYWVWHKGFLNRFAPRKARWICFSTFEGGRGDAEFKKMPVQYTTLSLKGSNHFRIAICQAGIWNPAPFSLHCFVMSLCTIKVDKTKKSHYTYLKILCPKLSPVTDFMLATGKNKTRPWQRISCLQWWNR